MKNTKLTGGQRRVLQYLVDNPEEDILVDGNIVYYGDNRTSVAMVYSLLRLCAISEDQYSEQRYFINETGKQLLKP